MISGVGLKVTADEKSSVKGRRRPRWEDKHTTKNTFHAYYSTLSIDTQVLYSKILSTFQDFEGQKDSKRHRDVIPLNLGRGPNAVVEPLLPSFRVPSIQDLL